MQAAQHEENIKSISIQQNAKLVKEEATDILLRHSKRPHRHVIKDATPPYRSITGPNSNFPEAMATVAKVNCLAMSD